MRRLVILLLGVGLALPVFAAWRQDATTATWYLQRPTAEMTTMRDALLWHYESRGLDGVLATSARPNIALTSIGGGNSELAITVGLTVGNNWVTALAANECPEADTAGERSACADAAIKADLKRIWNRYHLSLREASDPIPTPPPI